MSTWGNEIVGHLTDVGLAIISGNGGWGLGGYSWSSRLPRNRMMIMDDGLLHVFDPWSINGDIRDNGVGTKIVEYTCKPADALNESAWHTRYSPSIERTNGGIIYAPSIVMLDKTHPWLTMCDWWTGNTSFGGSLNRITVDMTGHAVNMNYLTTHPTFDDGTGYGVPVVVNGQRFYVCTGNMFGYYGDIANILFGYFMCDDTGKTLLDVHVTTGYFNSYIGYGSGYSVSLISAWRAGSSIDFATWDPEISGLMHIFRIDHPAAGDSWHLLDSIQITPGSTIDSIRMMDDGWLCFVTSVASNKHLVWWKPGSGFQEDYIPLQTGSGDVDFYTGGIFGGPSVGQVYLYAGGRTNPKGVFGFRYADPTNGTKLHVGIKIATLSGNCPTKTLYHTILSTGDYVGDNAIGFADPSILNLNGTYYFLFGTQGRVINHQSIPTCYYMESFVREGSQSNAIWYGE